MNKGRVKRVFCVLSAISLCAVSGSCARQSADLPQTGSEPAAAPTSAAPAAAGPINTATASATAEALPTTQKPTVANTTAKPTTVKATTTRPAAAATKKPTTAAKPAEKQTTTAKPAEKAKASVADYEAEALRLTNRERKKAGLKAFGTSAELQRCADVRAKEIKKKFSHTRPNGKDCFSLNPDLIMGENIASGQTAPKEVVDGWMASKSHRENILRERFTLCAVGCYYDQAGDTYYWVQLFG